MHNHLEDNWNLGNKKALFYNMRRYYQATNQDYFDYMPVTFHIQNGSQDKEYAKLVAYYYKRSKSKNKNLWIVKPGENTNRGTKSLIILTISKATVLPFAMISPA